MKFTPLHDRIVVSRVAEDSRTLGGLVIPDAAKEKPARGVVLAVGPGKRDEDGKRTAVDVEKGDEILFSKYAGTEIKIDGEEYVVLGEFDVIAIVEGGG